MTRTPSPPPELPGFVYVQPLGTGGFADVFLYEQQMPRRRVAVKVLRARRPDEPLDAYLLREAAFRREAALTAALEHPAIPPVYDVGRSDGRPALRRSGIDSPVATPGWFIKLRFQRFFHFV